MELRQLTIFQAVAKTLSFTRAAEHLSYSQSNVTSQVQALEQVRTKNGRQFPGGGARSLRNPICGLARPSLVFDSAWPFRPA